MNQKFIPSYLKALIILLLIIVIVFILIIAKSLLVPLFLGAYLSMLMVPICNWMERKKVHRIVAAVISILTSTAVAVGLVLLVVFQVKSFARDLDDVSDRLNNYFADIDDFVSENFGADLGIKNGIDKSQIFDFVTSNSDTLSDALLNTVGSLPSLLLIPVYLFFFLIYRSHITKFIVSLFNDNNKEEDIYEEISSLRRVVQYYIVGMFKVIAIMSILNTVALFSLGVKHALFFGLFAGLLNIIPYLGPFLGAILPFTYAFLTMDGLFYPFAIVVLFTIIQLVESSFITPKIVGGNVSLNALITFTGLLVGGAIWGIVGMILIIPVLAILKRMFYLSPQSRPYSFLLGEEEKPVLKADKKSKIKVEKSGEEK